MVLDKDIVTMKANRTLYAFCWMLLFPLALSGPLLPQLTPFSRFYITFDNIVVGGDRDFEFGR